ncbi:MAG TPA: terminase family protein [Ruminiclostridium sp.]
MYDREKRLAEWVRKKANLNLIKNDCEYFIEHYVHIEDRDSEELAVLFHLWDGQKKALQDFINERLNIVLKARQLGLTWLTLAYAVWCMMFKPGYMVVALSKKDDDAKELVRRVSFILRYMPESIKPIINATTSQVTILHKDGEPSTFKSFTAAPDSGRSFTANLVILDEWAFQQWARDIWTAAYPTINRPTGGKLIGLSTIERGSLFEDIWTASKTGDNTFNRIFLGWNTDPRRTKEWYEQTKKDLGDSTLAEYPETEEEAFLVPGGAYFTEYKQSIHIKSVEFEKTHSRFYIALDYGRDMLAAGLFEIDRYGYARQKGEVHKSGLLVSDAAEELRTLTAGKTIYSYLAPKDMWNLSNQTGKSNAEVFQANGIYLSQVIPGSREQGAYMLAEHLKPITVKDEQTGEEYETALLTFDEDICKETTRCLQNIQKDKNKQNEYANQPHNLTHAVDMLVYFVAGRPRAPIVEVKKKHTNWMFESKEERSDLDIW